MQSLDTAVVPLEHLNLIEASAGTGKTYTITSLVVRLIVAKGLSIDRILVVTFTEAATAELRDRVRRRLRDALGAVDEDRIDDDLVQQLVDQHGASVVQERLRNALRAFDEASIFTIHAFCQRMLLENAFESGMPFDTELQADMRPLQKQIVTDYWALQTFDRPKLFIRYLESQKVSVESLTPLVEKARPDVEVIGTATGGASDGADLAYQNAFVEAQRLWAKHRAEIEAQITGHEALYKNPYGAEHFGAHLAKLDRALATGAPITLQLPGAVGFLTKAGMAGKTRKGKTAPTHLIFDAFQQLLEAWDALHEVYESDLLALRTGLVHYARAELRTRKQACGLQSFDDLLTMLDEALARPGGDRLAARIRQQYAAALIDEFQDTDPVQYRIFSKTFAGHPNAVFLIGDPKQAIYAFRGADIFAYVAAANEARTRAFTLPVNYRADPSLVHAVNTIFGRYAHPFVFDAIDFSAVRPRPDAKDLIASPTGDVAPLRIRFLEREAGPKAAQSWAKAVGHVAAETARLLAEGVTIDGRAISEKDVAILVRSNKQAQGLQLALREFGVRSVLHSAGVVFGSEEAAELQLVLGAIAEPNSASALRAALGTDLFGLTGNEIVELGNDEAIADQWIQRFRDWRSEWTERGFIQMFRSVLSWRPSAAHLALNARLLSAHGGERRMTNLLHLAELIHAAARSEHLGITGQLRWIAQRRGDGQAVDPIHELRLESDETAIRLVTIHSSKGLEFPVVFCPTLWEGNLLYGDDLTYLQFHDPDDGHAAKIDVSLDKPAAHLDRAILEAQSESLRLAYVALTRAKHMCIVLSAWGKHTDVSPLGYLLHHVDGAGVLEQVPRAARKLSDEEALAELHALAAESGGAISVSTIDQATPPPPRRIPPSDQTLAPRSAKAFIDKTFGTSSFSQLASRASSLVPSDAEGRDHDETADAEALQPVPEQPAADEPEIPLVALGRGPITGRCVHAIYEHLDFAEPSQQTVEELVRQKLDAFGIQQGNDPTTVAAAIQGTLKVNLDAAQPNLRLETIPQGARLDELPFLFEVASPLTPGRLAEVMRAHATEAVPKSYASRIAKLGFGELHGFMKGFIDLVFEHEGRWYVVDYKTNFLGPSRSDYAGHRLTAMMHHHHYTLQSLIYSVAVHRYLGNRLAGYDFESHFGGIFYLFVRGMAPSFPAGHGVYQHHPTEALVEGLWSLFALGSGR